MNICFMPSSGIYRATGPVARIQLGYPIGGGVCAGRPRDDPREGLGMAVKVNQEVHIIWLHRSEASHRP